jgi:hypothetical protein
LKFNKLKYNTYKKAGNNSYFIWNSFYL